MLDAIRELFREALRDPGRTALTLFGVVLGAAAIVFLASALSSAGIALARTHQQASGNDVSRVQARSGGLRTHRPLAARDVGNIAAVEEVPDDQITATSRMMSIEAYHFGKRIKVGVQSGGSEYARLAGLELLHGRFTEASEERERVCMVGHAVWQEMSGGVWPMPNDTIVLFGTLPFKVVGVFKSRPPLGGGGGDGTWQIDRKLFVSNTVFARSLDGTERTDEIVFKPRFDPKKGPPDLVAIAMRLTPLIQRWHLGVQNFEFDALVKRRQTEELIVLGLGAILFACGLVAMVVGGVNVMNAQLVLVGEKTREYGIRRALGASAASLQRGIIAQTLVLTVFGASSGVGIGLTMALLLSRVLAGALGSWAFVIVWEAVGLSLGAAVIVGLLAGVGPARRAARLSPVDCLRARA